MEDEDHGPGDAAPAAASPQDSILAVTYPASTSQSGSSPTTATSRSSASSVTTTAHFTASSRSAASSTATSRSAAYPTGPPPPSAGAPQQPQNLQGNGAARGEPGGAEATASSTSVQIRRRPRAALARAVGASDVPVAPATGTGAPMPVASMVFEVPRPAPVRTMSSMRRASQPDRHNTNSKVDFAAELEKLAKSLATIGGGLAKIFDGFGLKIVDKAEKKRIDAEQKEAIEEQKIAEQKYLDEEKALNPDDIVTWRKKKEEEKKKKEEEQEKEKRVAFLLAIPGCLLNTSTIHLGFKEIASGSRDSVLAVGAMMRGIPSVMTWKRGNATGSRRESHESLISSWKGGNAMGSRRESQESLIYAASLGTGTLGLRSAIDRQILTRTYDGRIAVLDGFGPRKGTISCKLMGTRYITTMGQLEKVIHDFKHGHLRQLVDVNRTQVTLLTAYNMWLVLCNENLTGILHDACPLPEMAQRAVSILEEVQVLKSQLDDIDNATSGLESLISELRDKLEKKVPKEKSE